MRGNWRKLKRNICIILVSTKVLHGVNIIVLGQPEEVSR